MKIRWYWLIAVAALVGCVSVRPEHIFLPKLPPPEPEVEAIRLTGSMGGELVVHRGCVKLRQPNTSQLLTVLWHEETELAQPPTVGLVNGKTGRLYPFGSVVGVGGGYMSEEMTRSLHPAVTARCSGPYATGWFPE